MAERNNSVDTTIKCPKCGEDIALSQAITHQLKDQLLSTVSLEHQKELQATKLHAEKQLHQAQIEMEMKLAKRFQEQFEIQLKAAKEEISENKTRNKELLEQLTEMNREMRKVRQENEDSKLEMEKKLVAEQDKIRLEALKKAEDEQHLKFLELRKKLDDVEKANDELTRKLQQGSQQTQGEVLELVLEDQLKSQFPNDAITPVAKGTRGGDVLQEVIDRNGNACGKILWELKNTKAWSAAWVDKLKADQREIKAETAIIVSEALPTGINISGFHNGIWVTELKYCIALASALRANLIQLHYTRLSVKGKNEKMEVVYGYLSGIEFRQRVEAIIEAFTNMQQEIEKEKRYFMLKWARDEKNIRMVVDNTYGMHGDLKAIIGSSLSQIKGIEELGLLEGETS